MKSIWRRLKVSPLSDSGRHLGSHNSDSGVTGVDPRVSDRSCLHYILLLRGPVPEPLTFIWPELQIGTWCLVTLIKKTRSGVCHVQNSLKAGTFSRSNQTCTTASLREKPERESRPRNSASWALLFILDWFTVKFSSLQTLLFKCTWKTSLPVFKQQQQQVNINEIWWNDLLWA